jgi:tetratricopeptide (TPR) repeat protein
MKHPRLANTLAIAAALLLAPVCRAGGAQAEEHQHHHPAGEVEGLGAVHFPIGCQADVQPTFDRGMALLHSFGYEEARTAFLDVAQRDPACAMARWGEAMTWYHPVWAPPTAAELAAGRNAAAAAAALPTTERDAAFVAAIQTFYRDSEKVDHRTRALAYEEAMRQVMERFPDDPEATILYAELLAPATTDPELAKPRRAAAILEKLLPKYPRHPGIAHYLIHAFDYPQTAELALPAARAYAGIAPQAAHARHMPSHIFTRLGLWQESIASNWSSVEAAQARAARSHPGATAFDAMHAYDYLAYAYLQLGQDAKAREVLDTVARTAELDDAQFAAGFALAAVPARYALERHQWREAAALQLPPLAAKMRWEQYVYSEAILPFTRAVGAARSGDAAAARSALDQLAAVKAKLAAAPPAGPYDWVSQVESLRLAAAGWVARAERRDDEALRLLTQAAELEERVGKHSVTPGALLPAREQLGDLLLELGKPGEALAAYDASLRSAPRRFNSLAGATRAAELAGQRERASELATQLRELCGTGCERPEGKAAAASAAAASSTSPRR